MGTHGATSSHDLVELVRAGDADAFRRLFEKYHRRLALFIHYRLGDALRSSLDVDDVVQETFLEASRDLSRFEYRKPDSFFRWLASIARHVIEDAARRESRKKRDGGLRVDAADVQLVDTLTPSRIFFQSERIRSLMARLDSLPPQYREVIVLARLEGLAPGEIAERLGKPRDSVALLLHRALKRFRMELNS
jgi:RNA polymerase sigma-70 factor (ECF subfamily)